MKSRQGGFHISLRGIRGQLVDDIGLLAAGDVFRECLRISGRDEIIALIYKPIECLALFSTERMVSMPDSFHILSIVFLPSDMSSAACACDAEDGSVAVGCRDFWPLESGAGFLACWRMTVSFLAS